MSTEQIPLIDLTPFRGRDVEGKQRVAAEVARACEEVGFLMVSGHGVDQGLIDDTLSQTWIFFDLPDEEKRHWISPAGDGRRGYLPVGGNTLANTIGQDSPPDLIEAFTCGRFDLPDDPYYTAHRDSWFEPNIWPRHPSGFRDQLCAYYRAMEGLAAELMRIFATALGLPENYFADKIDKHITALRLNHYAAATQDPLPRQLRAGPHTDYGSLTILYPTRNPGGLQVYTSDDTWCDIGVDPVPGTFVVNIGDLHGPMDQRPLGVDAASRCQSAAQQLCLPTVAARRLRSSTNPITTPKSLAWKLARDPTARRGMHRRPRAIIWL